MVSDRLPITNTGKQTPADTIRTIREALEECRVCIEYYHAGVSQKLQARIAAARAIELLSTLEASLKAEPVGMSRAEFGDKMAVLMHDTTPPPGKYEKTIEMLGRYIDCGYRVYAEALKRESLKAEEPGGILLTDAMQLEIAVAKALILYIKSYELKDCIDDTLAAVRPYLRTTEPKHKDKCPNGCPLCTPKPESGNAEQLPPAGKVVELQYLLNEAIESLSRRRLVDPICGQWADAIRRRFEAIKEYAGVPPICPEGKRNGLEAPAPGPDAYGMYPTAPAKPEVFHGTHGDSMEAFKEYASRNDQLVYSDPVSTEKMRAAFQAGRESRDMKPVSIEDIFRKSGPVIYSVSISEIIKAVLEAAGVAYAV